MGKPVRRALLIVSAGIVAVLAASLVGITWNQRADDVCRENVSGAAGGYSVRWEWNDFAYVCDYRAPAEQSKRVGIVDAFHSDGRRRHRPDG